MFASGYKDEEVGKTGYEVSFHSVLSSTETTEF